MADDRLSITVRPPTASLVTEMLEASGLAKSDLFNAGIDVLHFVWQIYTTGGKLGYLEAGTEEYKPVHILIPGMIAPNVKGKEGA